MWTEDPGWFIHQLEVWNFFILGFVTSNFLYLSFSTVYFSSLWRADTNAFAKLNKPPISIKHPSPLPPLLKCV